MPVEISPNMNLPVPVVEEELGPAWAEDLNACMSGIDSHDHAAGKGVPITPDGININADLTFNDNNLTDAHSVGMTQLVAAVTSLLQTLQVVGADLYYIDGAGNAVRITQGGAVSGATGTITGLPSGTASASFAAGSFTFQSATNTPATMRVGPIVTGAQIASPFTVTISASASQPANYALTLPLALPASTSFPTIDAAGNMATVTGTGSGSVVRQDTPTINDPAIDGGSINDCQVGDITPATGTFTQIQVLPGPSFKTRRFTGSIGAGGTANILDGNDYNDLYGIIGMTSTGGSSVKSRMISSQDAFGQDDITVSLNISRDIVLTNQDSSNANTYDLTIFYID